MVRLVRAFFLLMNFYEGAKGNLYILVEKLQAVQRRILSIMTL